MDCFNSVNSVYLCNMKKIILDASAMELRLNRMATQMLEQNVEAEKIVLIGLHDRGYFIAEGLKAKMEKLGAQVQLLGLHIDKTDALAHPIVLDGDATAIANQTIIMVDDVASSGKTMFYAMQTLVNIPIKKLQVAVLVDRQHKAFPIAPDFVGFSLSTTLQEHIYVEIGASVTEPVAYIV